MSTRKNLLKHTTDKWLNTKYKVSILRRATFFQKVTFVT